MADDETDVEVLDVVGKLNENCGPSLVKGAGSEADVSCDVEVAVDVEEDDSCVVAGLVADVSMDEEIVLESETVSNVVVDVGWFPAGAADTDEWSPSCAEIAASSP